MRKDLGFVPLVTPASQIIGAQALSNILNKKYEALSVEIIDLALGYYGKLPGELDNLLLDKAKTNKKKITQRPADLLNEKFTDYQKDLSMFCKKLDINDLSSRRTCFDFYFDSIWFRRVIQKFKLLEIEKTNPLSFKLLIPLELKW